MQQVLKCYPDWTMPSQSIANDFAQQVIGMVTTDDDGKLYRIASTTVEPDQVVAECEIVLCANHAECHGEGKHQCPKCHRWFCDPCRELFLPIDPMFWAQTAMMCPQCHYLLYR